MITDVPGSAGVSIPILVDPAPAAPVQEQVSSPHYEQGAPVQEQVYCFFSEELFAFLLFMCNVQTTTPRYSSYTPTMAHATP